MSANRISLLQKPLTSHPTAAHRPSGRSGPGAEHRPAQSTQKPCGYRFASVFIPISDENRDGLPVAFRDFTERPEPYPASGPHSPSQEGSARAVHASVSCPPQEESHSGNMSGRLTSPGPGNPPDSYSLPGDFPTQPDE